MKRLLCIVLTLLLTLSLCSCGVAGYLQQEENGLKLYCPADLDSASGGDAITSVNIPWDTLPLTDKQAQVEAVLALLLGGCTDENFISPVPAGTRLLGCNIVGRTVSVDFSGAYGQLSGMDLTIADYCVALTLTQLSGIHAVRITVAGQELAYRDTNLFLAGDVLLTSTEDVVRTLAVRLYFPDSDGVLTAEDRLLTLYEGESRAGVVMDALIAGPETDGLLPLLPQEFTVLNLRTDDELCYLNLAAETAELLPEDATAQRIVLEGVVRSLCDLEGISAVQILVDGELQKTFGKLDVSVPWLPPPGE